MTRGLMTARTLLLAFACYTTSTLSSSSSSSSSVLAVTFTARQAIPPVTCHRTSAAAATAALPRGGFFWPRKAVEAKKGKRTIPILEVEKRSSQAELDVAASGRRKSAAATQPRSPLDRIIDFLEAPGTDMAIGITTILLVSYELAREIRKLGVAKALGEMNMALVSIVIARFLKALLACLKSTKQALRGYRTYAIVKRGKNVYLRQVPAASADDHHDDIIA